MKTILALLILLNPATASIIRWENPVFFELDGTIHLYTEATTATTTYIPEFVAWECSVNEWFEVVFGEQIGVTVAGLMSEYPIGDHLISASAEGANDYEFIFRVVDLVEPVAVQIGDIRFPAGTYMDFESMVEVHDNNPTRIVWMREPGIETRVGHHVVEFFVLDGSHIKGHSLSFDIYDPTFVPSEELPATVSIARNGPEISIAFDGELQVSRNLSEWEPLRVSSPAVLGKVPGSWFFRSVKVHVEPTVEVYRTVSKNGIMSDELYPADFPRYR